MSPDGNIVCQNCYDLGSDKRFLNRVTRFVHSMDEALLLEAMTFNPEDVEALKDKLRQSQNYLRKHRVAYETSFDMDLEKLHQHVRCVWMGRQSQKLTPTMDLWMTKHALPALEVEPGTCIEQYHVNKLMNYISQSKLTPINRQEIKLVERVITGKISQHPAIQGMLIACMNKLQCEEEGQSTVRSRHRSLAPSLGSKMVILQIKCTFQH